MTAEIPAPKNMRTFLIIWIGQLISIIGSGLTGFALGVWIFSETGQATPFALTVFFGTLPRLLMLPFAGSMADRWNRRSLLILGDTGSALLTLVLLYLFWSNQLQIWHIYLLSALSSALTTFQGPAFQASITMLVPKEQLARASGLVQMGDALSTLVSPLLAGLLFGVIGVEGVVLIDFITFFFAVGAVLLVNIPQPERTIQPGESSKPSVWKDALFGWRYLRARPGLFGLLLFFALVNFLLNYSTVLFPPMVLTFGTPATLGLIYSVTGAGMLAGSLVLSAWGGPKPGHRIKGVFAFIALASIGLVIAGTLPSAWVVGGGTFLLLFCIPLASGPSQAVFQTKVAPDVQGRVFAIRSMIGQSIIPVANLLVGPFTDHVFEPLMGPSGALGRSFVGSLLGTAPGRGMGLQFILSGLLLLVVTGLVFTQSHIRNVEHELPDVV